MVYNINNDDIINLNNKNSKIKTITLEKEVKTNKLLDINKTNNTHSNKT